MELNPNHRVVSTMRDEWHKVAALLLHKAGLSAVEITVDDIDGFSQSNLAIVADSRGGRFVIRLVSMAEAQRLAKQEGGLPC